MLAVILFVFGQHVIAWAADAGEATAVVEGRTPEKLLTAHASDPAVEALQRRLTQVGKVADVIGEAIEAHRQEAMRRVLAGAIRADTGASDGETIARAATLYDRFASIFAEPLPMSTLEPEELTQLRRHYEKVVINATQGLWRRAGEVVIFDPAIGPELGRLCTVLPILAEGQRLRPTPSASLPPWLLKEQVCRAVENFALMLRRPLIAAGLSPANRSEDIDALLAYLLGAGERLTYAHERYPQAIACFRAMIEVATGADRTQRTMAGHFGLVEVYERLNQPVLAAETLGRALAAYPKAANWPSAAVLRLRWLYKANQFAAVVDEARSYYDDPRMAKYRPECLYMAWIANRRLKRPEAARQLSERFLKVFPDHPLGADLHFVIAMDALAQGNYGMVQQELELIELRYQNSPLLPKVRQLQERLRQSITGDP